MKRIKQIKKFALVGGFGFILAGGLGACSQSNDSEISQLNGAMVVIEEISPGNFKIKEEYPSAQNRVILQKLDGSEKILSKEEMDELIAKESVKIDNGTSALTNPSVSNGTMGLGEALLSSAIGAIIGSYIGNKLFNNPNYQQNRQNAFKNPSAYEKSQNSFKNAKTTTNTKGKSGFFGGGSKTNKSGSFGG